MSISYDPSSKKWNVTKLRTDYPANRDETITDQVSITRNLPTQVSVPINYGNAYKTIWENRPKTISVSINAGKEEIIKALMEAGIKPSRYGYYGIGFEIDGLSELQSAQESAKERNERNKYNALLNQGERELNAENTKTNSAYDQVVGLASRTQGGDYKAIRDQIKNLDVSQNLKTTLENNFKTFYRTEKLNQWDTSLSAKPQYGDFDPSYYRSTNPSAAETWRQAVSDDDIDITERYGGEEGFYAYHYTSVGKPSGARGNAPEETVGASRYKESLNPKDVQDIRDLQLGVDIESQTDRLLNVPEIAEEWEKAKNGDAYWKQLAKEKYLDINKPDEFAALFRLSERPEDKAVSFNYNANAGYGVTELEDALSESVGEKATVDVKRFGALTQNILKDTIQEMKKARQKENTISLLSGFGGFSEITNINKELSNSIIGDSGVGGILSFSSSKDPQKALEKQLQGITGVNNSVTYNWQQWFDKTLKEKYAKDYESFQALEDKKDIINAFRSPRLKAVPFNASTGQFSDQFLKQAGFDTSDQLIKFLEGQGEEGAEILNTIKGNIDEQNKNSLSKILTNIETQIKNLDSQADRGLNLQYTADGKAASIGIDAQFARDYIDEYLTPRFNTSRSMNEFLEYLDVRQEEKNPFQTQDMLDAVRLIADIRAKNYIDQVQKTPDRYFDADFYFNPSGDKSRLDKYAEQSNTVNSDWEAAKNGDEYWATQAYRFGIDVNNKAQFAKMHFEVKGQGKGYDAADDIVNASKVSDEIYNKILPALKEETLKQGTVFGQFITPEEFADEMLKGLDPADKSSWQKVLDEFGLKDFQGSITELKEYIQEILRTGSAQEIRQKIKFLNEKKETPTQEKLGVTYIERPEDYKPKTTGETELFRTFKNAGYQGTEDEFYERFFPDVDREEQLFLTKAGTGKGIQLEGFNYRDPFEAISSFQGILGEDETKTTKKKTSEKDEAPSSFFRIGLGEDEEEDFDYKSKRADSILGEFTSMFKGFK